MSEASYIELMQQVEKMVKTEEIPYFIQRTPFRQQQEIFFVLKSFCEARTSANHYKRLEQTKPMYKKERKQSDYLEILMSTRLKLKLQASDEIVLKKYVIGLRTKLENALIETDVKKRFKLYEFICAGCNLCKVDNKEIMEQIAQIKEDAVQIIRDIPTM